VIFSLRPIDHDRNKATSQPAPAEWLWIACTALFVILSLAVAGWLLFAMAADDRSILRLPQTLPASAVLLIAGSIYGAAEIVRWLRRHASRVRPSLGTFFLAAVLLSGGLLALNGLLARKHSAETRTIEDLRVVDKGSTIQRHQPNDP